MSHKHGARRNHVKFEDDSFGNSWNSDSKYERARFPNLHMIFHQKETHQYDTESKASRGIEGLDTANDVEQIKETKKEDVDMEASEFIKRRHKMLDLQKLMSMKAAR